MYIGNNSTATLTKNTISFGGNKHTLEVKISSDDLDKVGGTQEFLEKLLSFLNGKLFTIQPLFQQNSLIDTTTSNKYAYSLLNSYDKIMRTNPRCKASTVFLNK
jgi:hypothetical protein